MTSKRFLFWIWISWGSIVSVYSQPLSPKIENLVKEVTSFTYSNKHDSAQALILNYLQGTELSDIELFYGHYLFANVLKSSGNPDRAIRRFQWCKNLSEMVPGSVEYESLIEGKIGECYFDLQNFEDAKEHALLSISTSPDSSLRTGGHAVNYIIVGYGVYLENKYLQALEYYNRAIMEYSNFGEVCELPLVYAKMATVYNALGNEKLAIEQVNQAIFISDSCGIELYELLSKHALFDIYNKNKNYKKALELILEINDLNTKNDLKKQNRLMSELEVKYETKLIQVENENLKQSYRKKEEILAKQKQALIISIIAIVVLSVLTFMLIRTSNQRKKTEQSLAILNTRLEQNVVERTDHLKKANHKIQENLALLAFQNKQLIDFCNIVSHNLRSPLVNMSMLIEFIEKSKDEAEQEMFLEKLKPVITNLNETFDELVESLQIKQDLEIESEKIDMKDCLNRILDGLEGEINESHADIEINFDAAPVLHYPVKYLSSIFHNLVSNAIKYRSPDRKPIIKLETQKGDGNIVLSVTDNGLGIDLNKHKENVFKIRKVFHKHPDARGFGLYITKTQVETMGGRIWVESVPNEGSTFSIEFKEQTV